MDYMRKIYGKVLRAVRRARFMTAEEIGGIMQINPQTVYGYERGLYLPKLKNAEKLFAVLKVDRKIFEASLDAYLRLPPGTPPPEPETVAAEVIRKSEEKWKDAPRRTESDAEIAQDIDGQWMPVISEAAAAECNPGLMPLLDCVSQYAEEKAFFPSGKKSDFVIRVSGSSMLPWYPPGTLLLVRPYQDIQNGKRVVAVLDEGEIIFKIFARTKNNEIALMSINDHDGRDYLFPASGKGIRYLCRVVQSIRNEDDLDDEMLLSGIHHAWEQKLQKLNAR